MAPWKEKKIIEDFCKPIHKKMILNRPLPSSKTPYFRNEAKCTTSLVKMSFIAWEWKIISISKAAHLTSFWYRGLEELGNGLMAKIALKAEAYWMVSVFFQFVYYVANDRRNLSRTWNSSTKLHVVMFVHTRSALQFCNMSLNGIL